MANGKKSVMEKKDDKKKGVAAREGISFPRYFDEMERFFDNFHLRGWPRPRHWGFPDWPDMAAFGEGRIPKMDVVDQEATLLVRAELPGVKKEDIEVSMSDNLLTVSTQSQQETSREEKGKYQRREIHQGSFSRSISLPVNVDASKTTAKFKDGVLELTFPKVEAARRRSIRIEG
ncbi:MAG: Hsp20/alpha crystallin family protein [Gammaproteobacteria bacterium]|nr:Hsp20/alpha crystallin family protein [Gammaproteobacteria bacterium]